MSGERRMRVVGGYRTHSDPMQVVSGGIHNPKVHFEAPPSSKMNDEMDAFVAVVQRNGAARQASRCLR